jgi:hypothetical protein
MKHVESPCLLYESFMRAPGRLLAQSARGATTGYTLRTRAYNERLARRGVEVDESHALQASI